MCGRYSLQTPLPDLADAFDARLALEDRGPRFNIAPTDTIAAVRPTKSGREMAGLRWGLIPGRARDPARVPLIINARAESLETRPAFRDLLAARRCLVPADGFYEWRTECGVSRPYFVRRRDGGPLALAGLWDRRGAEESCAIITTDANELLRPLHDRMPVVLSGENIDRWTDPGTRGLDRLRDVLQPSAWEFLEIYPVSVRVNRVGFDDPDCIAPEGPSILTPESWTDRPDAGRPAPGEQLGLF